MTGEEAAGILSKWLRFSNINAHLDNLAAYCPFHKQGQESSPSLYVYVGRPTGRAQPGASYCHTCGKGWTLTALLTQLGADRHIIDVVKEELQEKKRNKEDPVLIQDRLMGGLSFEQHTLPEALLATFDYCPRDLLTAGFDRDLLKEYDIGFDRDRLRIIFPFRDHWGNLVGVSGRTVVDEIPRYKIYKEEFFSVAGRSYECEKSKILWGLDKLYHARLHYDSGPLIVCEGFKAALWVKQAGLDDVVALIGTAISPEQEVLLTRVASEIVLFLDNDGAGVKATWRHSRRLASTDLRIVHFPKIDGRAPDDLSPTEVRKLVAEAPRASEWRRRSAHELARLSKEKQGTEAAAPE